MRWGYENDPITPAGKKLRRAQLQSLGTEDKMKLPFEPTAPSAPRQPTQSMEPMDSGDVNTPQWLQQVAGAR